MAGTSAGTRVYIGPANNTANDESAYAALTWTEIAGVETVSEFGDSAQIVTFQALAEARVQKFKGADDAGDVTFTCANEPRDPGQIAAIAAAKTKFNYPIKVVAADAPDSNDTDSVFYFRGPVSSRRVNVNGANDVTRRNFVVAINSEIVEVPSEAVSGG